MFFAVSYVPCRIRCVWALRVSQKKTPLFFVDIYPLKIADGLSDATSLFFILLSSIPSFGCCEGDNVKIWFHADRPLRCLGRESQELSSAVVGMPRLLSYTQ
jgi:hypothetical protein